MDPTTNELVAEEHSKIVVGVMRPNAPQKSEFRKGLSLLRKERTSTSAQWLLVLPSRPIFLLSANHVLQHQTQLLGASFSKNCLLCLSNQILYPQLPQKEILDVNGGFLFWFAVNALLEMRHSFIDLENSLSDWKAENASGVCAWTGVTCNAGGNIQRIDLAQLGLGGIVTPQISNLEFLEEL